ncbi:MAG: hypothetical protein EBR82_63515 [Caulobacteraceae bacterium]|nr:hypothetical protein [Caulobacteraceae bacterium]
MAVESADTVFSGDWIVLERDGVAGPEMEVTASERYVDRVVLYVGDKCERIELLCDDPVLVIHYAT